MKKFLFSIVFLFFAYLVFAQTTVNFRLQVTEQTVYDFHANTPRQLPEWLSSQPSVDYFNIGYSEKDDAYFPTTGDRYRVGNRSDMDRRQVNQLYFADERSTAIPRFYYASPADDNKIAYFYAVNGGYVRYQWTTYVPKNGFDLIRSTGLAAWLRHIGCNVTNPNLHISPKAANIEPPGMKTGHYTVRVDSGVNLKTGAVYIGAYVFDGDEPLSNRGYYASSALLNRAYERSCFDPIYDSPELQRARIAQYAMDEAANRGFRKIR